MHLKPVWPRLLAALVCLSALLPLASRAQDQTITLSDYGVTLTLPDGFSYISASLADDDPAFHSFSYASPDEMREDDVFLNAYSDALNCEIVYYLYPTSDTTLSRTGAVPLEDLEQIAQDLVEETAGDYTASYTDYHTIPNGQAPFVCLEGKLPSDYMLQYVGVVDGTVSSIVIYCEDPFSQRLIRRFDRMVSDLRFDSLPPMAVPTAPEEEPLTNVPEDALTAGKVVGLAALVALGLLLILGLFIAVALISRRGEKRLQPAHAEDPILPAETCEPESTPTAPAEPDPELPAEAPSQGPARQDSARQWDPVVSDWLPIDVARADRPKEAPDESDSSTMPDRPSGKDDGQEEL